jgi:hypothetical protein
VADLAGLRVGPALDNLARDFVGRAREMGFGEAEILAACQRALAPPAIERLVVVNQHEDLQALYLHELRKRIDFPLTAMTLEQVAALATTERVSSAFLTSTNNAPALAPLLADARPPVLFKLAASAELLQLAKTFEPASPVAVISVSPRFLFLTRELLAGVRDESTLVEALLDDAPALASALRQAKLVVACSVAYDVVANASQARVYRAPLLADSFFDELQALLSRF